MAHIAQNFTKEKMAHDTLSVYAELLEEKATDYNLYRQDQPLEQEKQRHAAE